MIFTPPTQATKNEQNDRNVNADSVLKTSGEEHRYH